VKWVGGGGFLTDDSCTEERERTGLQGLARKPDEQAEDEWMNGR